jgi:ribonuclease HI
MDDDAKDEKPVIIYSDGACSGNPGPGGWGAVLIYGDKRREISGGEPLTTNNRMELRAAAEALAALKRPTCAELHTDSEYLRKGITEWITKWKANGWKTAGREPVKNADLWRLLDEARQRHKISWHWVKGHAGEAENERADELARSGMAPFKKQR